MLKNISKIDLKTNRFRICQKKKHVRVLTRFVSAGFSIHNSTYTAKANRHGGLENWMAWLVLKPICLILLRF
jgi:hypothetical protein